MEKFDKWMKNLQKDLKRPSKSKESEVDEARPKSSQVIQKEVGKEEGTKPSEFYDNIAMELEPNKVAFKFLKSQVNQLDIMQAASDLKSKRMETVAEEIFKTLNLKSPAPITPMVERDIKALIGWKFQLGRAEWERRASLMRDQANDKIKEIESRYE